MAQLTERIAYRLAGMVWTAIYSGLAKRSNAGERDEVSSFGFELLDASVTSRVAEVSIAA